VRQWDGRRSRKGIEDSNVKLWSELSTAVKQPRGRCSINFCSSEHSFHWIGKLLLLHCCYTLQEAWNERERFVLCLYMYLVVLVPVEGVKATSILPVATSPPSVHSSWLEWTPPMKRWRSSILSSSKKTGARRRLGDNESNVLAGRLCLRLWLAIDRSPSNLPQLIYSFTHSLQ